MKRLYHEGNHVALSAMLGVWQRALVSRLLPLPDQTMGLKGITSFLEFGLRII
jgi:hypothetical protein